MTTLDLRTIDFSELTVEGVRVLALTVPDAARVTGTSRDVLDAARLAGRLTYRYPSSKPVIQLEELIRYVASLPTERP